MAAAAAQVFVEARANQKMIPAGKAPAVKDVQEAYANQMAMIANSGALGKHIGWKNGMTAEAAYKAIGLTEPWRAPLFACCLRENKAQLPKHLVKVLEGEFGFVMKSDLPAKATPHSEDEVAAAIDHIFLAIEVISGRCAGDVAWPQKISDGGMNYAVIKGPTIGVDKLKGLDQVKVTMELSGVQVDAGTGANVLGHPLKSLTWLANNLNKNGTMLKKGELIISGAAVKSHQIAANDSVVVRYEGLGSVEFRIQPSGFGDLLESAKAGLADCLIAPAAAKELIKQPNTLVLDVQDGPLPESLPNAINISLGTLPFKADASFADGAFKDPRISEDKTRPIFVTCGLGGQALIAAKLLKDFGFTNVKVIDGGNDAWKKAGCPMMKL